MNTATKTHHALPTSSLRLSVSPASVAGCFIVYSDKAGNACFLAKSTPKILRAKMKETNFCRFKFHSMETELFVKQLIDHYDQQINR